MRRLPGMPWTTSLSSEMHSEWRYGARWPGTPMNDGIAAALTDQLLGDDVQLQRADARAHLCADEVEDVRDQPSGDGHLLDLGLALERHAPVGEAHLQCAAVAVSTAWRSSSVT